MNKNKGDKRTPLRKPKKEEPIEMPNISPKKEQPSVNQDITDHLKDS